ncbi:HAD-IIA family hydrolase [Nocardioides jiangxiensis]|uniref:HAD-IIA family hydrolase n=1 Tax=Nocardioides jiangxiensis TaxID=3064524 RepID=A0ABT9AXS5_9ACTN|nr:HAD-IIA family hydrolase [Nocardioides sp. WY-20]MDO7866744.1 HAD-IIA family hydrolase [Nocardioides sp. WY-20]
MLRASDVPLVDRYDLAMLDLDGVVYIGDHAVPGAAQAIAAARSHGVAVAFVTNNAARPPAAVAGHLTRIGVEAAPRDVVTSSQAAARLVRERWGAGSRIFLCGGPGVESALLAEGLVPTVEPAEAVAVVTGYGPELPWHRILEAAILVKAGLPWVATNADMTIPTSAGVGPGHGAVVRLIEEFSSVRAEVAGKPERPLLDETIRRVGGRRPLMVGDRLDTDIEGAHNAGLDSLLVLTGVSGLADLVVAPPELRPTYLAEDLGGLLVSHPPTQRGAEGRFTCGGWTAHVEEGQVTLAGAGSRVDCWRSVVGAAWHHLDATGSPVLLPEAVRSVALAP